MRDWKKLLCGTFLFAAFSGLAQAELINEFIPGPGVSAGSFAVIFVGNVMASINAAATATDPVVNPFAYVNQNFFGGTGTSTTTVMLDGNGNTDAVFSGSHPVLPPYTFSYGPSANGEPHFGVDGDSVQPMVLSENWSSGSPLPSVSVVGPNATGPNLNYEIIFGAVTSGGETTGEWFELPFNAGTNPHSRSSTTLRIQLRFPISGTTSLPLNYPSIY